MFLHRLKIITMICVSIVVMWGPVYGSDVNIGIVFDGPWSGQMDLLSGIKQEIGDLTRGEFSIRYPSSATLTGEWDLDSIDENLNTLFANDSVDIIITLGFISSQYVCHLGPLPKPVIAPLIMDSGFQELPFETGSSGVKNLNYINAPSTFERDIKIFQEIIPFKYLAILINQSFVDMYPEELEEARDIFTKHGIEAKFVGIGKTVGKKITALSPYTQAVYVLPLAQLPDSEYEILTDELIKRRLPSFSYEGSVRVRQGCLVGLNKDDIVTRLSRRIALNVQRIILGDKPENIPVAISFDQQLTFNMTTGNAIDIYPSWAVMTEAQIIKTEEDTEERVLNLMKTVQEALDVNLDLLAKERYVTAGKENISLARANLLPQIDVSATGLQIDKDRAKNSMGQQAERTITGSVTATQVLFSEPAWANLSIQKDLQKSREKEYEQFKLDIVQGSATAYLNVLQAKAYERIQQENLKLTRRNLELARVREMVGSAGPAEVYRWESQIASNRNAVISANAQRNLAEIELNRILHRPAEDGFGTLEVDINDPILVSSHEELGKYIENKQAFRIFRSFMAEEALLNSPEIAMLDAAIAANERLLKSNMNKFFLPTVAVQAEYDNVFDRSGEGTDGSIDLSALLGRDFSISLAEPQDTQWSVALNASLPLFSGGARFAERRQTWEELHQLRLQRDAAAEKIEQRTRSSLHLLGASYASIKQAGLAAEAARKSLDVVQDSYSQGLVSIVELLDAQNAALVTDQAASTAVYDFFIKLMETERSFGNFYFLMDTKERDELIKKANKYFMKNGFYFN